MALRFTFATTKGLFEKAFANKYHPVATAATAAIKEAGAEAVNLGRASIAAAPGRFGRGWQKALRFKAFPGGAAVSANAAGIIYLKSRYGGVFEDGASIHGKPILWLPLRNVPKNIGRKKLTPAVFKAMVGPLFLVARPGRNPLLVARVAAKARSSDAPITLAALRRGAKGAGKNIASVPIFIGVPNVFETQKFHIRAAVAKAAAFLPDLYFKNLTDE